MEINNLIGGNGTQFITTTAKGKSYLYLVINEDTTFTALIGEANTNILDDLGIGSNLIRPQNGEKIKAVALASGSVFGILYQ